MEVDGRLFSALTARRGEIALACLPIFIEFFFLR